MRRFLAVVPFIAVLVLVAANPVQAGWNPFRKASARTTREIAPDPFSDADDAAEHRQLIDGSPLVHDDHHHMVDDDSPGLLSRMGQGTRQFFSSTRDALTFRRSRANDPRYTSSYSPWGGGSYSKAESEKSGWFSSWFQSDEPRQAETVEDWIEQPRPK